MYTLTNIIVAISVLVVSANLALTAPTVRVLHREVGSIEARTESAHHSTTGPVPTTTKSGLMSLITDAAKAEFKADHPDIAATLNAAKDVKNAFHNTTTQARVKVAEKIDPANGPASPVGEHQSPSLEGLGPL